MGTLPVVGNFAYPLQLLWSSTTKGDDLARAILYDGFARTGAHLLVWCGQDTLTEHWCNRVPEPILRLRNKDESPD